MRAVVFQNGQATAGEVAELEPAHRQLLVAVRAAGLNGADLAQAKGGMESADAVELPYQHEEMAMGFIVPHEADGLAAVEESLDAEALIGLSNAAQEGTVHLTMPKWEQSLPPADLFEWLCPLGFCPWAIVHESTGALLFVGRLVNPMG